MDEHATVLRESEELEALKTYDAVKSTPDDAIPLDQALAEIEKEVRVATATGTCSDGYQSSAQCRCGLRAAP